MDETLALGTIGFHGEQGAESIHNVFNTLERTYSAIQNPVQRMKNMLREHHPQVSCVCVWLVYTRGRRSRNTAKYPIIKMIDDYTLLCLRMVELDSYRFVYTHTAPRYHQTPHIGSRFFRAISLKCSHFEPCLNFLLCR